MIDRGAMGINNYSFRVIHKRVDSKLFPNSVLYVIKLLIYGRQVGLLTTNDPDNVQGAKDRLYYGYFHLPKPQQP